MNLKDASKKEDTGQLKALDEKMQDIISNRVMIQGCPCMWWEKLRPAHRTGEKEQDRV